MNAVDSSVVVAGLTASEEEHAACASILQSGDCALYAHGLSEVFHTLTGGRSGYRVPADKVTRLLEENVIRLMKVVSLEPMEIIEAMREALSRGVRGGAIYDYLHLASARKAGAKRLYTLDSKNFLAFARPGDPEIVHP